MVGLLSGFRGPLLQYGKERVEVDITADVGVRLIVEGIAKLPLRCYTIMFLRPNALEIVPSRSLLGAQQLL